MTDAGMSNLDGLSEIEKLVAIIEFYFPGKSDAQCIQDFWSVQSDDTYTINTISLYKFIAHKIQLPFGYLAISARGNTFNNNPKHDHV